MHRLEIGLPTSIDSMHHKFFNFVNFNPDSSMPLAGFGSFCKMNFQKLKQTFGTAKNQHPFLEYKMHLEVGGAAQDCSTTTPVAGGGSTSTCGTSHAVDTTTPEQDYVLGTNFWRSYRLRQHTASNSSASSSYQLQKCLGLETCNAALGIVNAV